MEKTQNETHERDLAGNDDDDDDDDDVYVVDCGCKIYVVYI